MSVSTSTSLVSYVGNNSTSTAYVVTFPFFDDTDLVVVKKLTATGVETALTLTTDYSVTGAGDPEGGEIVTVAAIPNTYTVTIYREIPATQPLSYINADDFPAASHEEALDRLTYLSQQNVRKLDAGFQVSAASGSLSPFTKISNGVVGTDSSGNATMLTGAQIQTLLNLPATVIDQPTKTFANAAARATATPDFLGQVGVQLDTFTHYTGTTLVAGGWTVYDFAISGGSVGETSLASNAVTTVKIANANVTAAKLAGDVGANAWLTKDAAYTAVAGDRIAADTTDAAFTVKLPATPSTNETVTIVDAFGTWATNNLTVDRNGKTISGASEDVTCDIDGKMLVFLHNGTTWRIFT